MARVQLNHVLLDVNFLHKPKVVALRSRYGHVAALVLIEIYSMMSRATNAEIDIYAAYHVAESLGLTNGKELIEYCVKNEMLTIENETLSNIRVTKDQEKLASHRERKAKNQAAYREQQDGNVTDHEAVTPVTDTVTEDVNLDLKKKSKQQTLVVPDWVLQNSELTNTLTAWITHRQEKKSKLTQSTLDAQLRKFNTPESFIAAVNHSIEKGWTGLFPPDTPLSSTKLPKSIVETRAKYEALDNQ